MLFVCLFVNIFTLSLSNVSANFFKRCLLSMQICNLSTKEFYFINFMIFIYLYILRCSLCTNLLALLFSKSFLFLGYSFIIPKCIFAPNDNLLSIFSNEFLCFSFELYFLLVVFI